MSSDSNAALHDALAERGNRLGRDADARFVGGGQEKWPQERTMDTLAKRQLSRLHRRGESSREPRRQLFVRPKQRVPVADEIHRQDDPVWMNDYDCRGAPVKPEAGPMPSISSQRGQHCAGWPFNARSTTRCAIFSTTCEK